MEIFLPFQQSRAPSRIAGADASAGGEGDFAAFKRSGRQTCMLRGVAWAEWLEEFRRQLVAGHRRARSAGNRMPPERSLLAWSREYLPEHFRLPPSRMHHWLERQLMWMSTHRGSKLNVLGPRGSAKSTVAALAYPLFVALHDLEPYIWIVSDSRRQAVAHLENIKQQLLDNPRLASDYPEAVGRGPVWRASYIILRNGVAIEAFGTGQRIRGRRRAAFRPTLIICDDLQNDQHMQSALQREHSRQWFHGTLMQAGTPSTNVIHLATALHAEALGLELTRTAGWKSRVFSAIERWPDRIDLWQQWEDIYGGIADRFAQQRARQFYEEHRAEMEKGARVLWPEAEDLYTLMCQRATGGRAAFEREKQNRPIQPQWCEWPEEYFAEPLWFEKWPSRLQAKVMALDPSKGADARRGDYSAFVVLGLGEDHLMYVEADLGRRSVAQLLSDGAALWEKHRPDLFAVESNQFQELLAEEFAAEFRRQHLAAPVPVLMENRVSKLVRLRRLGPYLASKRLRFKSDSASTRLLVEQLREFPVGDHDDGPDALEMAVRLVNDLLRPRVDDGLGSRLPVG